MCMFQLYLCRMRISGDTMEKIRNSYSNISRKLKNRRFKVRRNYKDSIFRKLFNNNAAIIELYNALSGSDYPPDTDVRIVTLRP
mgnify:CR=1 FL=1